MPLARLLLLLVVALVLVPVVAVFSGWLNINPDLWVHLYTTRIPQLLLNTFYLLVFVGAGVLLLGVGLAWLTSMYDFTGRKWLEWALMLPLAIPAYVMAFVFLGLFDYSGPVQSWLRAHELQQLTITDIRHPASISLVMASVLYPYVYLLARTAFLAQGLQYVEAAQSLGASRWRIALTVNIGMARPAIIAGLALVLMETLADFGTVAIFNYDTFTLAIYKAWFDYFDLQLACQLASLLLLLVAVALFIEYSTRGKRAFNEKGGEHPRKQLHGLRSLLAFMACFNIVFLCFLVPVGQLLIWAFAELTAGMDQRFLSLVWHTLILAGSAALITAMVAMVLSILQRFYAGKYTHHLMVLAKLGYALPGTVLAVGIVMPLGYFEQLLFPLQEALGMQPRQLLLGTVAALLVAYIVRFMTVAVGPLETSLSQLSRHIPEAAYTLESSRLRVWYTVYYPLIRPGLLMAMLLVFVDVMKEMPATLLMRPFGWDTLAVRIYELTSEGEFEQAALPALCLLLVGLIPIVLTIRKSRQ